MTKKIIITLSIIALFASCTKASGNNSATHDEGVVINGVRWATRNVDMPGTFAETPECFGMLFQWNRKKAWNAVDEYVEDWDRTNATGTKWYVKKDPCPQGWRIPTREESQSLDKAGSDWTTQNSVYGRLFGVVPHQIFLPAAGWRYHSDGALINVGADGDYWSSTGGGRFAMRLWFGSGSSYVSSNYRAFGFSVRCVSIN